MKPGLAGRTIYRPRACGRYIYSYNTEGPRAISFTELLPTRRGGYVLYPLAGASGQHGPACAKSAEYRSVEE